MDVTLADLQGPDAARVLAGLRDQHPVAWVPSMDAWIVTSHALARQVVRDDVTFTVDDPRFSTAQVVGPSMLSLDGVAHRQHRSAFAAPFRPARVNERFGAEVERLTDALLDRIRDAGRADLRTALAGPLSVAVVVHALGLRDIDPGTVLRWYADIVGAVTAISAGEQADAVDAMQALRAEVLAGLDVGTASVLRDATASLDEDAIVSNAAVMMFGGIETTEGMIANALLHLLTNREAADRVRADPTLASAAVEESLRLEPAAAAVDRYATSDVELAGARIRRGDLVRVSITAANRDPAVYPSPDEFRLDRAGLRDHLAFAQGPHICIAMDLARLEARVAVARTLTTLADVELDGAASVTGLIFRKPGTLPARWTITPWTQPTTIGQDR